MSEDAKVFSVIILSVAFIICTLIISHHIKSYYTTKNAMEHGYIQTNIRGSSEIIWQKAE